MLQISSEIDKQGKTQCIGRSNYKCDVCNTIANTDNV